MRKRVIILFPVFFLQAILLIAQCPSRDSIKKSIIQHKIGIAKSADKLAILLYYRNGILNCHFERDTTYAWLLQSMAYEYYCQKRFSEAVSSSVEAIEINKSVKNSPVANRRLIDQYFWLSLFYDSLNNLPAKRKAIDSCIAVSQRLGDSCSASLIRGLAGRLLYFYDIGEYRLCINDAEIAERCAREYAAKETDSTDRNWGKEVAMYSFHWHINALFRLKEFDEARRLIESKLSTYKKNGPKSYLALTYAQLAELEEERGNYEQVLANFTVAFNVYRENGNNFNCKQTLNNIGERIYFRHFHDYDKALAYFKNALRFKNNLPSLSREDSIESSNIYGRVANVYVQKKMFDSAFYYFQVAFGLLKKGGSIIDILYSSPDEYKKIDYLTTLFIDYGDAYRKIFEITRNRKDLEIAADLYDRTDKFFAKINLSQFDQDSKLLWREETRRLYEHAIESCYLLKNPDKAFYFFERSRAVLLNIQLNEQNLLGNADISGLNRIKKRIAILTPLVNSLPDSSTERASLEDSLQKENDRLYNLIQFIKTNNPLYYQNLDTAVLSLYQVRNELLKERQAILEIFSGDSSVYALLVTGSQAFIHKIDKTDMEITARSYLNYLSDYNLQNKDFSGFRKTAQHLYELIFQNSVLPQGRIIVSPEGYYFPFESLITDNRGSNPVYFISGNAVSYTYSVRYLFNSFSASAVKPAGNFLGVAPVNYSSRLQLPGLAESDRSVKDIKGITGKATLLLFKDASKSNFLQQFPSYRIIQLYTHAMDSSDRREPVIYFNDSALYLSELTREERPVTELVVLAACETGNGILYKGEGVFSFNRAFASLGIPSSVSNLWSVDNKATYQLTEAFYRYMAKGLPLDIALQKAKLDYMSGDMIASRLPCYWAAPVIIGKADRITISKPFAWDYFFAALALAAVFLFIAWRTGKSRKARDRIIPAPGKAGIAS